MYITSNTAFDGLEYIIVVENKIEQTKTLKLQIPKQK